MKTNQFIKNSYSFRITLTMTFLMVLMFSISIYTLGQNKKSKPRMRLSYHNNVDNTKSLIAEVFVKKGRQFNPVTEVPVYFYIGEEDDENILDSTVTDKNGFAILNFEEDDMFPVSAESRKIPITAVFKGNDLNNAKSAEISVTQISMELFLTESGGLKTLSIRAYELGQDQELFPAEDATVNFYIPRLFSDQKIGESDILNGKCNIEFPENIAGDSIGNMTVIARIEDHDEYGYVERKVSDFRWGTKEAIEAHKDLMTIEITIPTRGLWHSNAPLWMIITLAVLLIGVWSHYFYVISQLIKLSRMKKKANKN